MTYTQKQTLLLTLLFSLYCTIFYFMWTDQLRLDFYSFYSAAGALFHGDDPYKVLTATYLPTIQKINTNLNPPALLLLLQPLSMTNHHTGMIIWTSLSFTLGLIAASVAFKLAFSIEFYKEHRITLYIIYLSLFSTLMNTGIAQIGNYAAFLIIAGYYFYRQGRDTLAAFMWGMIISIKLFPGLLFFYVLRQQRYKTAFIMATTVFLMWLVPLLAYGMDVYTSYFTMLPRVLWYGDNWNASIYGFLFRLFVDTQSPHHLRLIQSIYTVISLGCVAWYLKKIYSMCSPDDENHQAFCLTLVMMLLISPFGWMYYFSLLLLPLLVTWSQVITTGKWNGPFIWLTSLFLINFPSSYVATKNMATLFEKLGIYSLCFYGLVLLAYLLSRNNDSASSFPSTTTEQTDYLIFPMGIILGFGVIIVGFGCVLQVLPH